uniref:Uncharacterized protein n=1 Tax=Triticum urartu TaxID=4572 RepID=A0A8R7V839_TRIUA
MNTGRYNQLLPNEFFRLLRPNTQASFQAICHLILVDPSFIYSYQSKSKTLKFGNSNTYSTFLVFLDKKKIEALNVEQLFYGNFHLSKF